jgi:antitoxin VapB
MSIPLVAKLFTNGRSQAVRLPAAFRFDGDEVFIWRDEQTGNVVLSRKPSDWDGFLEAIQGVEVPEDFPGAAERDAAEPSRDPFAGWDE